ncbi:MAG TPA: VanZ family protein [Gemmatimonadales bacterium]
MSPRRWLPFVCWAVLVLTLTSIPNPHVPVVPGGDKAAHAIMYGVLGGLAAFALVGVRRPLMAHVLALAGVAALAALDEWHQLFIPGRSADVADWMADVVGATLVLLFSAVALRRREPAQLD